MKRIRDLPRLVLEQCEIRILIVPGAMFQIRTKSGATEPAVASRSWRDRQKTEYLSEADGDLKITSRSCLPNNSIAQLREGMPSRFKG